MKFTHVLNPYAANPRETRIHRITLESLATARALSPFEVQTLVVGEPDLPPIEGTDVAAPLERSVADCHPLRPRHPFPLLRDVLRRGWEEGKGDTLIYTNMDIAVQPHFYLALDALLNRGLHSLVVNRRWFETEEDCLPLLYSQSGEPHRGYDCFVFPRVLFPDFNMGDLCLGIPWVGLGLYLNLRERGGKFAEFKDLHLTFHLGREQPWTASRWEPYRRHNRAELEGIRQRLNAEGRNSRHPWLEPRKGGGGWKRIGLRAARFFS